VDGDEIGKNIENHLLCLSMNLYYVFCLHPLKALTYNSKYKILQIVFLLCCMNILTK